MTPKKKKFKNRIPNNRTVFLNSFKFGNSFQSARFPYLSLTLQHPVCYKNKMYQHCKHKILHRYIFEPSKEYKIKLLFLLIFCKFSFARKISRQFFASRSLYRQNDSHEKDCGSNCFNLLFPPDAFPRDIQMLINSCNP